MKIIPRAYQAKATIAGVKALRSPDKRALVVLATGLGKTFTAAFIIKKLRPTKTLFLVHNNHILKHAFDEFRLVLGENINMVTYNGMSKKGSKTADIVFATWQTMGVHLEEWKRNSFDLIIVDEAHHSEADTYRPIINYFTGAKLGITATPDREDKADIRSIFGPEVINVTLEEAIARGWLPRIEYHVITDESLDDEALQKITAEIRESKRRFTMAEVNRRVFIRKREKEVARIINGYSEKAVVFCPSTTYADRMAKWLELGESFHSKKGRSQKDTWDKNQATLINLKNGLIRRVTAVNAFNEGVNVPSVGLIAFCRVTGVLTIFRQQLGRGLRPGKDVLIVLDFVGNLERIQLILEIMNKISDLHEKFTPKEEIEREAYVRQKFEVSGKGFEFTFSDRVKDLMKVLEHCERDFYPTWQEAASAARSLGIDSVNCYEVGYKKDPRLPSNPNVVYEDFPGYGIFLGTGNSPARSRDEIYLTYRQAGAAAIKLGIKSRQQYYREYKKDSSLPSSPEKFYSDFVSWGDFLRTGRVRGVKALFYKSWKGASKAACELGILSSSQYRSVRKRDKKLPGFPEGFYADFPGWGVFLKTGNTGKKKDFYPNWTEAGNSAKDLGIKGFTDYLTNRKKDPRLPSNPDKVYLDFPGWLKFLGKV